MSEKLHVVTKNVLGLRTNVKDFVWSYGTRMPEVTREEYDACPVHLCLQVGQTESLPSDAADSGGDVLGKYHYFGGVPGAGKIHYRRPFFFGSTLELDVAGLLSPEPTVTSNPAYYRFIKHRFMNLHSVGYILTDIASLLLLRNGFAPIHCSAFRKGDATVVVFAPPNTGKTLTTMTACIEHGAEFIAEDLAITDGRTVYSVPWTSTFRYYSDIDRRPVARAVSWLTEKIPPLELLPLLRPEPIDSFVAAKSIVDRSKVTHVALLERGSEDVVSTSSDDVIDKMVNLNRYEFCYIKSPLITAYEFFNPQLDVNAAYKAEKDILRCLAESAEKRLVIRTPDATRYASLILDTLGLQ